MRAGLNDSQPDYLQPAAQAATSDALNAGMVGVNHMMVSTPETPFGGVNESGYGSESGSEGLEAYLRTKFVAQL